MSPVRAEQTTMLSWSRPMIRSCVGWQVFFVKSGLDLCPGDMILGLGQGHRAQRLYVRLFTPGW